MTVSDVQSILEAWAPRGVAWERDNVGLQVGSLDKNVKRILVTLDVSENVVREATRKRIDLIVAHHPLLFRPISSLTQHDRIGRILYELVKSDIALYATHTNLDFSYGGVSFALANRLGLKDVSFLRQQPNALRKITVFVPGDYVERVSEAMAAAGAGVIGNYENCSFRLNGTGTFRGREGSRPFVGQTGQLERVQEVRLEMVVPRWRVQDVVRALKNVHPYEEVAYDVYVLENDSVNYGAGALGVLPKPMVVKDFLSHVKRRLKVPFLRYNGDVRRKVHRVAVCGGSGSEFLEAAIDRNADAFVTADVRYHTFEAAGDRIVLVDAGHCETELPSLEAIVQHIQKDPMADRERIQVYRSSTNTNSVHYH